ncbi:MAG: energy transducer TonB [Candidatus Methylomirabilales bacterium]
MTLRDQPLLRFLAVSALVHSGFLGLLQFTPPPDPLPDLTPLRIRFVEPPAGPLVDQPPPRRPEPAPPGAKAIGRSSSRAKAPGPGTGPVGSAESRGTPRLPTSPLPPVLEPALPSEPPVSAPLVKEARPAPEATARRSVPSPPQATAPPSRPSPPASRLSLREQLARIGNRALLSPVPGPYDAGRVGEGSGREATVALESRSHEYAAYLEEVKRRVEREWRYPLLAQERGLTGKLVIEFAIRRDGGLTRLHLADSSGVSILDDAALDAIRRAAPYSPLPDAMDLDRLNVVASFEYLGGLSRVRGGS